MCKQPIEFGTLVAYWLGELAPKQEAPIEEHLFTCASCSVRLEQLASLASGVRAVVRGGRVATLITPAFLDVLKREGLRVREYRVPRGGRVDCTLRADDDAVVGRMQVPLAGVQRLDVQMRLEVAGDVSEMRFEDVAFDPGAGEVLNLPSAAALRAMPANTLHVRLLAVEAAGERTLGEYTFAHTPG